MARPVMNNHNSMNVGETIHREGNAKIKVLLLLKPEKISLESQSTT